MTRSVVSQRGAWHERIVREVVRFLGRLGIRINPFLVVREAETIGTAIADVDNLRFSIASANEINDLLRLQRGHTRESLRKWFEEGKLCFVARDEDQLVALMWCDREAFNYPPNFRSLVEGEAYLFAAVADPEYRGRSVAPALRLFCYEELRKRGVTRFFSYTDYFNVPARRFKAKLGARDESLRVAVDLWGLWSRTITLRRYG